MRIVTSDQMRQIEETAFANGVPQQALMQAAGEAVAAHVHGSLGNPETDQVLILVGPRNNGGDGLVVAQALLEAGVGAVTVWLYKRADTSGAPVAPDLLEQVTVIQAETAGATRALSATISSANLIVDAVYGLGGHDTLPDDLAAVLREVNARVADPRLMTVALDLPTGVNADTGSAAEDAFIADLTVTLGRPKLGLFQPAGTRAAGRLVLETLGLEEGSLPPASPHYITADDAMQRLPYRSYDAHKGDAGGLLLIGGSLNYIGAPVLAAQAALRSGVGLLTLAVPRSILGPIASQVAEATYLPLPEAEWGTIGREAVKPITEALERYTALLIGNGLGREKATAGFLTGLLGLGESAPTRGSVGFRAIGANPPAEPATSPITVPVVIDADGLNLLSEHEQWWEKLAGLQLILTPHHGELARLRGVEREAVSANPWQAARDAARDWGQVVVLKGGYTIVATPDGALWVAPLANPALATAGTGDTLAGLIAGLLAQKLSPVDAAILGVWIGAHAADEASLEIGTLPLLAGDLPVYFGRKIVELAMGVAND